MHSDISCIHVRYNNFRLYVKQAVVIQTIKKKFREVFYKLYKQESQA